MAGIDRVDGLLNLGAVVADSTNKYETVGAVAMGAAASTMPNNAVTEFNRKMADIAAVSSLVTGSMRQNSASAAFKNMDFKHDEYLKEIGVSTSNNMNNNVLHSSSNDYLDGSKFAGTRERDVMLQGSNGSYTMNTMNFTQKQIDNINSTGQYTMNGVTYDASVNGSTVSIQSNVETFHQVENSTLKIDIDPTGGLVNMSTTVAGSSFSEKQMKSIQANGTCTIGGNTYRVKEIPDSHSGSSSVGSATDNYRAGSPVSSSGSTASPSRSGASSGPASGQTHTSRATVSGGNTPVGNAPRGVVENRAAASAGTSSVNNISNRRYAVEISVANNSVAMQNAYKTMNGASSTVTQTMYGKSLTGAARKSVEKNGTYDLGGMKFSAVPVMVKNPQTGEETQKIFNADKFKAMSSRESHLASDSAMKVNAVTKKGRAEAVANVQQAGIRYIKSQGGALANFDGSKKSLEKCRATLKKDLKTCKDPKVAGDLKKQLELLKGYERNGGTIVNPTGNPRFGRGMRVVGRTVLGSDYMSGVMMTASMVKIGKLGVSSTTKAASKLAYKGSDAATRVLLKGTGKLNEKFGVGGKANKILADAKKKNDAAFGKMLEKNQAKRSGRYRQYKRQERALKRAGKGDALKNKIDALETKGKAGNLSVRKKAKNDAKIARTKRRLDRHNKMSNVRAKAYAMADRLNFAKKFRESKVGKVVGGIVGAPFKFIQGIFNIGDWIKRKIRMVIGVIALSYIKLFLMAFVPAFLLVYIVPHFFSTLIPEGLKNAFKTGVAIVNEGFESTINGGINYQQLIVDTVYDDIAFDYKIICQVDATNHYLTKRTVASAAYPWFVSPKFGKIEHQWAWEESDNVSRYLTEADEDKSQDELFDDMGRMIGSGEYKYLDTYVPQRNRTEIDSITFNMYPIVGMSHVRYHDEFSFDQWETVLGYTYYMFVVSHDIAKYDNDQSEYNRWKLYSDQTNEPGYDYKLTTDNFEIYEGGQGIEWDGESHTLTRPTEACANVYIHDFAADGYSVPINAMGSEGVPEHYYIHGSKGTSTSWCIEDPGAGFMNGIVKSTVKPFRKLRSGIAELAKRYLNGTLDTTDALDKGYTDQNCAFSLALRRKSLKGIQKDTDRQQILIRQSLFETTLESLHNRYPKFDIDRNNSGIFIYDNQSGWEGLPHAQYYESALSKYWTQDEYGNDQGPFETFGRNMSSGNTLGSVCGIYSEFPYGIVVDSAENREEDLDLRYCEHGAHTYLCHPLKCGETEHDGYEDEDTGDYVEGHSHSESCYDISQPVICGHHHTEWGGKDSPGCWKTVVICNGHCGGHIEPSINIVQKVTYKGLADDDNFGSPHWLTQEEILGVAGSTVGGMYNLLDMVVGDEIATVAQFRAYWYDKVNSWFSPIPRSVFGFYKKVLKEELMAFVRVTDGIITAIQAVWKTIATPGSGGLVETYRDIWEAKHDGGAAGDMSDLDPDWEGWSGWWIDDEFDITIEGDCITFYGGWFEDQYEASKDFWSELSLADKKVDFPQMGIHGVVLTEEEINEIINKLLQTYSIDNMDLSGLTDKQIAIIRAGLERCGTFGYSLSGPAHQNGINNDGGLADCSGWVTGTLLKALGINYNTNAAGFAAKGTYGAEKLPGSVIAHTNGGAGYSGHVMIYVGYLSDGPEGAGKYVMDCSSSVGGSSIRKMNDKQLDRYKYVWNP